MDNVREESCMIRCEASMNVVYVGWTPGIRGKPTTTHKTHKDGTLLVLRIVPRDAKVVDSNRVQFEANRDCREKEGLVV